MAIKVACMGLPLQGPKHVSIEADSALTLRDLVTRYLAPQFDGNLVDALFDANGLPQNYVILVNGRNALELGGLDILLEDQAEVLITPPVTGG
jgi:molybdopterin converting factor small subunit